MCNSKAENFAQIYNVYEADAFGRVPTLNELDPNNQIPIDSQEVFSRRIPIQKPIDKTLEVAVNENGLLYDTMIELNRSGTKKIIVGINPYTQFQREIRIYGTFNEYITLTIEEVRLITELNFDLLWDFKKLNQTMLMYRNPENNICTVKLNALKRLMITDHKQTFNMKIGLPTIIGLKETFYIISGLYHKLEALEGYIASNKILKLCLRIGIDVKFDISQTAKVKDVYFNQHDDYECEDIHLISTMLLKFPSYFMSLLEWNWEHNCNSIERYDSGINLYYNEHP